MYKERKNKKNIENNNSSSNKKTIQNDLIWSSSSDFDLRKNDFIIEMFKIWNDSHSKTY